MNAINNLISDENLVRVTKELAQKCCYTTDLVYAIAENEVWNSNGKYNYCQEIRFFLAILLVANYLNIDWRKQIKIPVDDFYIDEFFSKEFGIKIKRITNGLLSDLKINFINKDLFVIRDCILPEKF